MAAGGGIAVYSGLAAQAGYSVGKGWVGVHCSWIPEYTSEVDLEIIRKIDDDDDCKGSHCSILM